MDKCERCSYYDEENDKCEWKYWDEEPMVDPCPEDDPYDGHPMPWNVYSPSEMGF